MLNHCNFAFLKSCPFCPSLFLADRTANFLGEGNVDYPFPLSFIFYPFPFFVSSPSPTSFFFYPHSAKPIYRQIRENVFSLVPVKLARLIKKGEEGRREEVEEEAEEKEEEEEKKKGK